MQVTPSEVSLPLPPAWDQGWLEVGDGHRLYYEQWGRHDGPVALVLHGGPGSGFSERLRSCFNPDQFRVVAFDQRGCGRSTPRGECAANTTAHALADIEQLRDVLGIERWLVVGGSWGATLGLAYATRCPAQVSGLLLHGFFWPGASDIARFFASQPWYDWAGQLMSDVMPVRQAAALAWWHWEFLRSEAPLLMFPSINELEVLCDRYRVQAHYLQQNCWLTEADLGRDVPHLAELPIAFLHGSADQACPLSSARRVQGWLAGSVWQTVPEAGHDPFHPAMVQAMREALQCFRDSAQFAP
jgi:proline iminopeptidase